MARPQRNDCDYFPFYVKNGKTFSLLRRRWPLAGVGFFTELCIILTRTPYHHVKIDSDLDFEYFIGEMGCDIDMAKDIISLLAETGKVHQELWEKYSIIVMPDLLNSLGDAYEKRSNEIVSVEEILVSASETIVYGPETPGAVGFTGVNTPKGKERKGKETNICTYSFDLFWSAYPKKKSKDTARKVFKKRYNEIPEIEDLLMIVHRWAGSPEWTKDGGTFIPYAATWLNAGGWEDELPENTQSSHSSPSSGVKLPEIQFCKKHNREIVDGKCPVCEEES